jgi:acetylglutamate kinase
MEQITVIKIGGNIIDHEQAMADFLQAFAGTPGKKILVHGGGKLATRLAEKMEVPQQMIDGRRITDAETLKIVTMVYAGFINKNIVAQLQALGVNAIGLSGADGNLVLAHKRTGAAHDYGFVGDVDVVNTTLLQQLLDGGNTIVIAPITHDGKGQLLNTNADTMAQTIAQSLGKAYAVNLVYSFEKAGVLRDANDDTTVIPEILPDTYQQLKAEGAIFAGMIPKLDNAFAALSKGVNRVIIGNAQHLPQLIEGTSGTSIIHE